MEDKLKLKIMKIKTIPFKINQKIDEVISDNLKSKAIETEIQRLGYGNSRVMFVDGIKIYRKDRNNAVYIAVDTRKKGE